VYVFVYFRIENKCDYTRDERLPQHQLLNFIMKRRIGGGKTIGVTRQSIRMQRLLLNDMTEEELNE